MSQRIDLAMLLAGCANDAFDDGIRIDCELEPISGPGGTVKPAVYEGGNYQHDRRWASPTDAEPTEVIVIDNVPSQANRLEDALRRNRASTSIPEFVIDFSDLRHLPAHLPRSLSSLQFPHRNADAYLRDAQLDGVDFLKTDVGQAIFNATAQTCGPLIGWFPQALLYGFWQSHLGKKRQNTKHARAWVSEIIGWQPASTETKVLGLKGDALSLIKDVQVTSDPDDRTTWKVAEGGRTAGAKHDKLSEIGHGQVPFMGSEAAAAAISFARVTQRATVSLRPTPAHQSWWRRFERGGCGRSGAAGRAWTARPPACLRQGASPFVPAPSFGPDRQRRPGSVQRVMSRLISVGRKPPSCFSSRQGSMRHPAGCRSTDGGRQ